RGNAAAAFLGAFLCASVPFVVYYFTRHALWNVGKFLTYVSPYLVLLLCLPLVKRVTLPGSTRSRARIVSAALTWGGAVVFLASQFVFGAARVWNSRDPIGIGYSNATYPSIQEPAMKSSLAWNVEPQTYARCTGVRLFDSEADQFYVEYLKQKLA